MKFTLTSATAADEADLRGLLRETPLPGRISVTLEREPSFFGADADVLRHEVALSRREGRAVACGSRVLRRAWWQGEPADTAYLADLRVHPDCQGRAGRLIARGFSHLEADAVAHPAAVTWTAVFEGNARARGTLSGARAGLPHYQDRGRLLCPVLPVSRRPRPPVVRGLSWQAGSGALLEEIAGFLTARQRHRPLAPVHTAADFAGGKRWPGLRPDDFLLARRGADLAGVVAVWDQGGFRQVRMHRMSGPLRLVRRLSALTSWLTGFPALSRDGEVLPMAHVAFLATAEDSPDVAHALLLAARAAAACRGLGWLCVCLHEGDPHAPALGRLPALTSHGRLYEVSRSPGLWPAGPAPVVESALL